MKKLHSNRVLVPFNNFGSISRIFNSWVLFCDFEILESNGIYEYRTVGAKAIITWRLAP